MSLALLVAQTTTVSQKCTAVMDTETVMTVLTNNIVAIKVSGSLCRLVTIMYARTAMYFPFQQKSTETRLKNIKNVNRCRDGMPKSRQTR